MINSEKTYDYWLEGYLNTFEAEKRLEYLQKGLNESPDEKAKFRKTVFISRYCNKKGELTGGDSFIAAWLELKAQLRVVRQPLVGKKLAARNIARTAEELQLTKPLEDWQKEILQDEYLHMVKYYVILCQSDRSYNSRFMGFMAMADDSLRQKLIDDIKSVAFDVPSFAGMDKAYAPIKYAVNEIINS